VEPLYPVPNLVERVRAWSALSGKEIHLRVGDCCDAPFLNNVFAEFQPEAVLITEPTNLNIYRGQRGRLEMKVRTDGVSCHGSAPERGVNAIYKMAPIIQEIEEDGLSYSDEWSVFFTLLGLKPASHFSGSEEKFQRILNVCEQLNQDKEKDLFDWGRIDGSWFEQHVDVAAYVVCNKPLFSPSFVVENYKKDFTFSMNLLSLRYSAWSDFEMISPET